VRRGEGKMRAAVLHGVQDLRLEDVPRPELERDQVRVRISVNGLCGSDIHFFEHGRLGPFVVDKPYIPGHEASGVVVTAAADDSGPAEGTRVTIEPGVPCRRCAQCKSGRYNLCPDVVFMSAPPVNGTFADEVAVAGDFVHPLPDSLDDEAGAFVEPVSVGVQACVRAGLRAGATVVVLGAGPIGLVTLLTARAFGAARLVSVDRISSRLALAGRLGADVIDGSAAGVDVPAAVKRLTAGRNAEFVFDATGSSAACGMAPLLAGRGGSVTLIGWPETSTLPLPVDVIMERELDVHGVNRYCNTYPRAIALMASGAIDTRPLVSHRYPFAAVCDAFAFASRHRDQTVKVLVRHT
jgi:L-iditol 2-dehydrogenase